MTKRVVFYARYSDELCSSTSIQDQLHRCEAYAKANGWTHVETYADREISGRSAGARPDFMRMRSDAEKGRFDVVLAEAPDRLSRRTADLADLRDRLAFHRVDLHCVNLGLVTPIHAAVLGVVAEQFSRDLADKAKRGQTAATRRGRVAAGLAYGYVAVPGAECNRAIVPEQADVVRRIFEEYANGLTPQAIARRLNEEGVRGPRGKWSGTTIRGDAKRRTGILRNRHYVGEIEYGRTTFRTDPHSGKRLSTPSEVIERFEAPELRIVDETLWARVEARLAETARAMERDESGRALNRAHRARFVLSGLLRCGWCGGPYAILGKDRYGCSTRKNKGTCRNAVTITRQAIESRVLAAVKRGLLEPELVERFVGNVTARMKARQSQARSGLPGLKRRQADVSAKVARLLDQLEDGVGETAMIAARLRQRESELRVIESEIAAAESAETPVVTLPNFAKAYADLVRRLEEVLRQPELVQRAHETLATMIEKVVLTPDKLAENELRAEIHGKLAHVLKICSAAGNEKLSGDFLGPESQMSVVAGVGFEPTTFRL